METFPLQLHEAAMPSTEKEILPLPGNVILHEHALIKHKLSMMRDQSCETATFRELTKEIGSFLCFQASANFPLKLIKIKPFGASETKRFPFIDGEETVVVPILRSGLVVAEGVLQAMPVAHVGHLGFRRREKDYAVEPHLIVLPNPSGRRFLLCDTVIGTGNTACEAINILISLNVPQSSIQFLALLITREGAEQIHSKFPDVIVHSVSLEDGLDERRHIAPGFGDSDKRLFGIG